MLQCCLLLQILLRVMNCKSWKPQIWNSPLSSQYYHLLLRLPRAAAARLGGESKAALAKVPPYKVFQWQKKGTRVIWIAVQEPELCSQKYCLLPGKGYMWVEWTGASVGVWSCYLELSDFNVCPKSRGIPGSCWERLLLWVTLGRSLSPSTENRD